MAGGGELLPALAARGDGALDQAGHLGVDTELGLVDLAALVDAQLAAQVHERGALAETALERLLDRLEAAELRRAEQDGQIGFLLVGRRLEAAHDRVDADIGGDLVGLELHLLVDPLIARGRKAELQRAEARGDLVADRAGRTDGQGADRDKAGGAVAVRVHTVVLLLGE